jgi:DNA-binding MarR family transcriptional regulator
VQDQTRIPHRSDLELLQQVANLLTTRVARALVDHELTVDQWRVLHTLALTGARTMSELAQGTQITGPTLSRVVDRLVERALVYRNVDAADRRRVVVHAADRGRALCEELAPAIGGAERQGLAPLSSEEARTLRELLERIAST